MQPKPKRKKPFCFPRAIGRGIMNAGDASINAHDKHLLCMYVCHIRTKSDTVKHIHVKFMDINFRSIL
jgi:hypothetical protein